VRDWQQDGGLKSTVGVAVVNRERRGCVGRSRVISNNDICIPVAVKVGDGGRSRAQRRILIHKIGLGESAIPIAEPHLQ
jgi:hypothetical protein